MKIGGIIYLNRLLAQHENALNLLLCPLNLGRASLRVDAEDIMMIINVALVGAFSSEKIPGRSQIDCHIKGGEYTERLGWC